MKKVKVFIAMIAVALGGLIIWSCTQDEMENRQGTYRYSAEEIATLRAIAEKYGVPEVVFETESGIPLPRLEEMEETFKNFGLIKASLTAQLEVIDSTSNSMVFKTKKIPFKRLSSISESMKTEREITYGTLIWNISWQQSVYNGSYQCPAVSATGTIEFSPEMQRLGYFTSNNRNFCSIRGTELYITFECQINYSRSHFNFAYSDWVHPGFRPYR